MSPLLKPPPEWGIEPVPAEVKKLRSIDIFVLWSSLGVGLLVFLAGSLLVPGLGLAEALAVSLIGSIIGSILLASAGLVGSKYGVPTMVSLRPILGIWGSYIPTMMNVVQLVGWTAFELMIMGQAATRISGEFLGEFTKIFWIIVFAIWCATLALGGPLIVVRQWLEKIAIWLVYGSTIWITWQVLIRMERFFTPGDGSLPILYALDLVIAMPISWWPLISDYNRFAEKTRGGFIGTLAGYTLANTWFYFLGAAIVVVTGITDIVTSISILFLGSLALLLILVDETDNAFADIYSTAVSLQNIFPKIRQWKFILVVTLLGVILASTLPLLEYERFLLMIGGMFVPLLGILISDYLIVRRGEYKIEEFYKSQEKINLQSLTAWIVGVAAYFTIAWNIPNLGASLPALAISMVVNIILNRSKRHIRI
ncbi:MAG: cytosine permease [Candidatus Caldarchaeales archaeon]